MNKIERIKELVKLLNHYRDKYYNSSNSEISDFEYDNLFDELANLESKTGFILATSLDYFDEMGLSAFSSGINLILIITILICNWAVNKLTGASLDKGIGGN